MHRHLCQAGPVEKQLVVAGKGEEMGEAVLSASRSGRCAHTRHSLTHVLRAPQHHACHCTGGELGETATKNPPRESGRVFFAAAVSLWRPLLSGFGAREDSLA